MNTKEERRKALIPLVSRAVWGPVWYISRATIEEYYGRANVEPLPYMFKSPEEGGIKYPTKNSIPGDTKYHIDYVLEWLKENEDLDYKTMKEPIGMFMDKF